MPSRLAISAVDLELRVDLAAAARMLTGGVSEREADDWRVLARASGVDGFDALHVLAGARDGVAETAWWVSLANEPRGIVDVVVRGAGSFDEPDPFLALVPARASSIAGVAVRAGAFLRGLDGLARRRVPELAPDLDALFERVRASTGLAVRADLFALAEMRCLAFTVLPPAGGFFAEARLPDLLVIARTDEVEGAWALVERVASHVGARVRTMDGDPAVRFVLTRPLLEALAASWTSGGAAPSDPVPAGGVGEGTLSLVADLAPALCRLDLEEGWSVFSVSMPSALRYRDRYRTERKIVYDPAFAQLARESLAGATAGACVRGSDATLAFYRTFARLAPRILTATAGGFALEPALLPPAEAFLHASRPGGLRLECGASGFGLRARGDGGFVALLAALGLSLSHDSSRFPATAGRR